MNKGCFGEIAIYIVACIVCCPGSVTFSHVLLIGRMNYIEKEMSKRREDAEGDSNQPSK